MGLFRSLEMNILRLTAGHVYGLLAAFALAAGPMAHADSGFYRQHNLVSDVSGRADHPDTNVVNAWGLAAGPTTPWWIANNGSDTSTLYDASADVIPGLVVSIPGGAPTGMVFNAGAGFVVHSGAASGSALFIFASEAGIISGWSPAVPPPPPSTQAQIGKDNSATEANYKGLAILNLGNPNGAGDLLYATNFHAGTVDVFDSTFNPVVMAGAFIDPNLPAGYAPFGIRNLLGTIYVTYALKDPVTEDDIAGPGQGFVNAFDTAGNFLRRVASGDTLNAPWGLALAPGDFGRFSNNLIVGNFGDGRIHAYDPNTLTNNGEFEARGPLHSASGPPIVIDGLWALAFGNGDGGKSGPTNMLFFTAGPDDEGHGLFGSLVPVAPPGRQK